jgi:hypothetical protein
VYSPVGDFFEALSEARSARDLAYALSAPSPYELGTAGSNEDAIATILRTWATARRDATALADLAYERALRAARGPEEEAETRGELAELWLAVQEDVEIALLAAAPANYRDDPSLVRYVQLDIVEALRPLRDKVANHLEKCRMLLRDFRGLGAARRACETAERRLAETSLPHVTQNAVREADGGTPLIAGPRALRPTTHPKPCVFQGSVLVRGGLFADAQGGAALHAFDGTAPIEVDALEPAATVGGRYQVTLSWPYVVSGYLESADPPFVLKRQVDIVVGHVWAAEGERVATIQARGPTARVVRDLTSAGSMSELKDVSAAKVPTVLSVDRRIFCRDLDLASMPLPALDSTTALERLNTIGLVSGLVGLHRSAGGREVARLPITEVRVAERRGAFVHVSGATPIHFDGWIRASLLTLAAAAASEPAR